MKLIFRICVYRLGCVRNGLRLRGRSEHSTCVIGVASALKGWQTRARGRRIDASSGVQSALMCDIEALCEQISRMGSLGKDRGSVRRCPGVQGGGTMLYTSIGDS